MEHIKINFKKDLKDMDLSLRVDEVKILYNACIDILEETPEMISYNDVAYKLKKMLEDNDRKKNKVEKPKQLDLFLIGEISIWLGVSPDREGEVICWLMKDGRQVYYHPQEKWAYTLDFIDCFRDFFALKGIFQSRGVDLEDAYTEDECK
jgi:hypothetical protein